MLAVVARAFLVEVVAGCWQWLLFLVAMVARAFLVAVVAILGGNGC